MIFFYTVITEYVQPIHLYDTRKDKLSDFVSDPVVLAGWGHMTDCK